jgi:alpha-beta hydrolase superfamily lysophospholipase
LDHPGFGLSEGLHGYIPSFDELADNVIEQYTKIKGSIRILSCNDYKVIVIISCFSI